METVIKITAYFILLYVFVILISPKNIKATLFSALALMPICLAFSFFNFSPLLELQIVKIFYPKSLVIIGFLFTVALLLFRIVIARLLEKGINNMSVIPYKEMSFMQIFYIACWHIILGTALPFGVTILLFGNIVHFFQNVILFNSIYFSISLIFFIFSFKLPKIL